MVYSKGVDMKIVKMTRAKPEFPNQPTMLDVPEECIDRLIARGWKVVEDEIKIIDKVKDKSKEDKPKENDTAEKGKKGRKVKDTGVNPFFEEK